MKKTTVINLSGGAEPFSLSKVKRSAKRVGASPKVADEIAQKIQSELYEGMLTSEIYSRVKELLHERSPQAALKFSTRQAIKKLGPTGFPFERFAGEVFSEQGYKVAYNQMISGHCTNYEVDFVAEKDGEVILTECKFRSRNGDKVDVNVALQGYARLLDIENGDFRRGMKKRFLVVTNEKFTTKAIRYSSCVGLELLGWRYPSGRGLEYHIDIDKLYPITVLSSLKKRHIDYFSRKKKMMVRDVLKLNPKTFKDNKEITRQDIEKLQEEARLLFE